MWENQEVSWVREDALAKLKSEIEDVALEFCFEIRLIGGLLKFTPFGVYSKVFLELEQPDFKNYSVIYTHRTRELTSNYKGEPVSTKWVVGFLEANTTAAKELVAKSEAQSKITDEATKREDMQSKRRPAVTRVECGSCHGEGRWRIGDPRDGDLHFEYCSACSGAGYVDT